MPAFHPYEDTLATGWVTGSMELTTTRQQLSGVVYPANWVNSMQFRLYCSSDFVIASRDNNSAEIPVPAELWFPLPLVAAESRVWARVATGTATLYYIIDGRTTVGSA